MSKHINEIRRTVSDALDSAFGRALEQEDSEGKQVLDIRSGKFIIFSDQHKGNRDGADDFLVCERAYNAALAYYDRLGYTLAVLGDVEELWEEWPETVLAAYPYTLDLEGKFHRDGRYLRFWGNHDDAWSHRDLVERLLSPALGGSPLKVRETILLHLREGEQELGRFFLVHGHQGTFTSDRFSNVSRLVVRYIWRPIQRVFKISVNTPAKDFKLRYAHNIAMYSWSEAQEKIVLIAGHTHRPVFKSETHEMIVHKRLQAVEEQLEQSPENLKLQQQASELTAALEWVRAQEQQSPADLPLIEFKKPSYFNTGCCAYLDGDITGLEISDAEIRLVRWPDDEDAPRPKVLVSAKLKDIFAAC